MPGAGKSILTSVVVDHLYSKFQNDPKTSIAYIYIDYSRQDEHAVDRLLASLLKQLSESQSFLPTAVQDLYKRHHRRGARPSVEELTDAIESVATLYSRVFILIDALDEWKSSNTSRSSILSTIFSLRSGTRANLFATARFIAEITDMFHTMPTLEIRASDEDVQKYLRGNLCQLPKFVQKDASLQERIVATILEAVQGM